MEQGENAALEVMKNKQDLKAAVKEIINRHEYHKKAQTFLYNVESKEDPKLYTPERWDFFSSLTRETVQDCFDDPLPEDVLSLFDNKPEEAEDKEEYLAKIYSSFDEGQLIKLYEDLTDSVPRFNVKKPTESISVTDKVSRLLYNNMLLLRDTTPVRVVNKSKKRNEAIDYVYVDYNLFPELAKNKFAQSVMNAFITLIVAGNDFITIDMIQDVLAAKTDSRYDDVRRQTIYDIETMLLKGYMRIDLSEECRSFGITDCDEYIKEGNFITGIRDRAKLNGQMVEGIRVYKILLLDYAKLTKKIARCPMKYLRVSNLSMTEDNIVLRDYLRGRILEKYVGDPFTVLYNTVYEELGISNTSYPDKTQLSRRKKIVRTNISKILACFKENGFITDYEEDGKRGIKIYKKVQKPVDGE